MEKKIATDLHYAAVMQRSLAKAYETLKSEASSLLIFSIQWQDLEEHFDSTRDSLQAQFEKLRERQKELTAKEGRLDSRAEDLRQLEEVIQKERLEFEEGKRHMRSVESLIEDYNQELKVKEGLYSNVEKMIKNKERELGEIEKRVREWSFKMEMKERELEGWVARIESEEKRLESKAEELIVIETGVKERLSMVEAKEKDLGSLERPLTEREKCSDSVDEESLETCQIHLFSADSVAVFLRTLIERKQLFEALRFIFMFKLLDEFPPVPILKEYLEITKKCRRKAFRKAQSIGEKATFMDNHIGDLRAMIECIREYKLECECPLSDIEVQLVELEKLKENWKDKHHEKRPGNKRNISSSSAYHQGQDHRTKFHRRAEEPPRPFIPVHLYAPMPSSMAYGNYGHHGRYGTTANAGMHNVSPTYPSRSDHSHPHGPY